MAPVDDPGFYFQTDESIATIARKAAKSSNKHGSPIKVASKILAVQPAPEDYTVYIAEATGCISIVDTKTRETKKIATPAAAPLTSITISPQTKTIFVGCWDKNIYGVPVDTPNSPARKFSGHTDFVKCLLATSLNGKPLLLSGGADATLMVWDIGSGKPLHKLKGHTKAIQAMAIDPLSISAKGDSFTVFSASSNREIRQWHIGMENAHELPDPILEHDTSVYAICFDSDGDLWTGSADKTVRHLVRSRGWKADTTLQHPDFVRDVAVAERQGVVVTACRDEDVRVWDIASGDLLCTYQGHFEEVMGLVIHDSSVTSVSIDATIRVWPLDRPGMNKYLVELKEESLNKGQDGAPKTSISMLTAEEEAELAELMGEDDD